MNIAWRNTSSAMAGKQQKPDTLLRNYDSHSGEDVRRYVLDFGPAAHPRSLALSALEGWLANGSKYSGAFFLKSPTSPETSDQDGFVSAIELNVRIITTTLPSDQATGASAWAQPQASPVRSESSISANRDLTDASREMVSRRVRSALAFALGEGGRDVVLAQLQLDYGFGFSEVTDFPGRFIELLNEILQSGARFVEERILEELALENPSLKKASSFKEAIAQLATVDTVA